MIWCRFELDGKTLRNRRGRPRDRGVGQSLETMPLPTIRIRWSR